MTPVQGEVNRRQHGINLVQISHECVSNPYQLMTHGGQVEDDNAIILNLFTS